jgi:predicted nucleotidyltransferase component of viral defense system
LSPKQIKGKTVTNIGASVRARLLNIARNSRRDYNRILVQYVQERLLYRFSISRYRDNFILKGALLFITYDMPQARPTKDIDFLGLGVKNDVDEIKRMIQEVTAIKIDDGVIFYPSSVRVRQIAEQAEYIGTRVSVQSSIGGARNIMQIDIGFGDKIIAGPIDIEYPTMLDYPAPRIKIYSLESAIAEKFEAIVRLNVATSRMKDFYDIIYLSKHNSFKAATLFEAIKITFETRNTPISDCKLIWSDDYKKDYKQEKQWTAFHTTNKLDIVGTWTESIGIMEQFLAPVIDMNVTNKAKKYIWNQNTRKWE